MSYPFRARRHSAWGLERKVILLLRNEAGHQLLRASWAARLAAGPPLSPERLLQVRWLISRCERHAERYREAIGAARRRLDDLAGEGTP